MPEPSWRPLLLRKTWGSELNPKLERYARQVILPEIGEEGQRRLGQARVLVVGTGALGGFLAEFLVRAGVGFVRLVDRDVPSLVNLHRQIQFDEWDVEQETPKAEAAARRLSTVNSEVTVEAVVADATARRIPELLDGIDLVLDGTDNFETRFIVNDACVQAGIPWIYGGVLGTNGMVMVVRPSKGPCLRCLMPELPQAGSQPTCETAGVLAPAVAMVASVQAGQAIRMLASGTVSEADVEPLVSIALFPPAMRSLKVRRDPQCPCCGGRHFDFLDGSLASEALSLCGRNAVQVTPAGGALPDLEQLHRRLAPAMRCDFAGRLLRIEASPLELLVFPDGRVLVLGTSDPVRARSVVAQILGM